MTNPRGRDQINLGASASQPAAVDALDPPRSGDPTLVRWAASMTHWRNLREGLSSDYEKAVTRRDLDKRLADLGIPVPGVISLPAVGTPGIGLGLQVVANGALTTMPLEDVAAKIASSTYFTDLIGRSNDSGLADSIATRVQQNVLAELATAGFSAADAEAARLQLSAVVTAGTETIRAATDGGLRELAYVSSGMIQATAGQHVWKLSANGVLAGTGLASTPSLAGATTYAILLDAAKVAIVTSTDVLGTGAGQIPPLAPPANRIPFAVDADGVYLKWNIKTTGKATFNGSNTIGTATFAVVGNTAGGTTGGVYGLAGAGSGVYGEASGGTGVTGAASGATGIGVTALNTAAGGIALSVQGIMTMTNAAVVANLNAERWNGATQSGISTGTATATFATTNKPGGASTNSWLTTVFGGITYYLPAWT